MQQSEPKLSILVHGRLSRHMAAGLRYEEELDMRFHNSLAAAVIVAVAPVAAHAEAGDPGARVTAYDDAIIAIMKQKLGLAARVERFRGWYANIMICR